MKITLLFILSFIIISMLSVDNNAPQENIGQSDRNIDKIIEAELVFKIGSDKENEDFYDPYSFSVASDGRIFILDTRNSRIQCFSKEGKYLFSFGREGQGPGELSKVAKKIKILQDGNIYIIDYLLRNINVYDSNGKHLVSWKTEKGIYDDIEKIGSKYYLSNVMLREDNRPIHIFDTTGKTIGSIGKLIEPENGLIERIGKEKDVGIDEFFCHADFSSIKINSKNEIIYSQKTPYRLFKIDPDGRIVNEIHGNDDYVGADKFVIYYQENIPRIKANFPLPIIYSPNLIAGDEILVPFMKKERDYLFIDLYDQMLNHKSRYKVRDQIADKRKYEAIRQTYIDSKNNLYCLIISNENPAELRKYSLIFKMQ